MSELRTPEVEDLLTVFSKIQDKDDIFLLLEDLFTIREIRETSQRLAVARQLDAGTAEVVLAALKRAGTPSTALTLELTEMGLAMPETVEASSALPKTSLLENM